MRFVYLIFLIIFSFLIIQFSSAETKTIIDSEGFLKFREKMEFHPAKLSCNLSLSKEGFNYFEPSIITPVFSLGRLYLKGMLRDVFNSDGITPTSSVLTEKMSLRVSDSMEPGSRYGLFFNTKDSLPFYVWAFKTNSYGFFCGTGIDTLTIINLPKLKTTNSLLVNISSCKETVADSWFEEEVILPEQAVLNMFSEIRCNYGDIDSFGRKYNLNTADKFCIFFSFLGGGSFPVYTEVGQLLRAELTLGNKIFSLKGIIQYQSPKYIDTSGELTSNNLIQGISAFLNFTNEVVDINLKTSYCHWKKQLEVIPKTNISQKDKIDLITDFSINIFDIKIDQEYSFNRDSNGILSTEYDTDIDLKFDFDFIRLTIGGGLCYERYTYVDEFSYDWMIETDFVFKIFTSSIKFSHKADKENEVSVNANMKLDKFTTFGKISVKDFETIFIEIGFEI